MAWFHVIKILIDGEIPMIKCDTEALVTAGKKFIWHPFTNSQRPIRNVIVLIPPFCITPSQLSTAIEAIRNSIVDVCDQTKMKS
jgi:adenosylmethionine-8-amino-7-oxononanoate aminotransferase